MGKLAYITIQLSSAMILTYWIAAGATATLIIQAFLKDGAVSKVSLEAWTFITVATLLWPITLPFIISSKLRATSARQAANARAENALEHEQPFSAI